MNFGDKKNNEENEVIEFDERNKMTREVAVDELTRLFKFYGLKFDLNDDKHSESREKMVTATQHGRITFDLDKEIVTIELIKPVVLKDKDPITKLVLNEPTADQLVAIDKYEEKENIKKSMALTQAMTGIPEALIGRMRSRDFIAVTSVVQLFF